MGETIELLDVSILFGYNGETKWSKAVNYCILYGKNSIVKATLGKTEPFIFTFLLYLKSNLLLEKAIASKNGKLGIFDDCFETLLVAIG
jgi:hypothetical protein